MKPKAGKLCATWLLAVILLASCSSRETIPTPLSPIPTSPPPTQTETQIPDPTPSVTPLSPAPPTPSHTSTPQQPSLPAFEPSDCRFEVASPNPIECGFLLVPENREVPDSPQIRIHVAIFKSNHPSPKPDPVIYVAGGGGVDQLGSAEYYLNQVGNAILQERDFIMYNQRGSHRNKPSLVCPDLTNLYWELAAQGLDPHSKADRRIEVRLECHDDLQAKGIDLAAYNTVETAADIRDLLIALGYDQVNLYGTSSGTRTILTVMRNHPENIRSVILDSVYPPQVGLYSTVSLSVDRVFSLLFDNCIEQPECSRKYPDLEESFYQLIDELNANPASIELSRGTIPVNGTMFMEALWLSFYSVNDIALVPERIDWARQDVFTGMKPWLESLLSDSGTFMAMGFEWSMMCNEETPFESYQLGREQAVGLPPQVAAYFDSYYEFTLCESWQSGQADPVEDTPVVSTIPALVLAGLWDPVTPPRWSQLAAETLSRHFYYEFPGLSHGIIRSNACGLDIGLQFINDPLTAPDATCMDGVPGIVFK